MCAHTKYTYIVHNSFRNLYRKTQKGCAVGWWWRLVTQNGAHTTDVGWWGFHSQVHPKLTCASPNQSDAVSKQVTDV